MAKFLSNKYPWLSLNDVLALEPAAAARGVSVVARGPKGFLRAYEKARGKIAQMPDFWPAKRDGFIARHRSQALKNGEPPWKNGEPTNRTLALAMWAYSSNPARLRKWLSARTPLRNPAAPKDQTVYVLAKPTYPNRPSVYGGGAPTAVWVPDFRWGTFDTNLAAKRKWVEALHQVGPDFPDAMIKRQFHADSENVGMVKVLKMKASEVPQRNPRPLPLDRTILLSELEDALAPGIHPQEFGLFMPEFLQSIGVDLPVAKAMLDESLLIDFGTWINDNEILDRWFWESQDIAKKIPARYVFDGCEVLPPGSWVMHYSPAATPFFSFRYGCTVDKLAYAWNTDRIRVPSRNLDASLDPSKRAWIFGFLLAHDVCVGDAGEFVCCERGGFQASKYGRTALLFRTDVAVESFHEGDQEQQVIAAAGSEYDVAWVEGNDDQSWTANLPWGERKRFRSANKMCEWVHSAHAARRQ